MTFVLLRPYCSSVCLPDQQVRILQEVGSFHLLSRRWNLQFLYAQFLYNILQRIAKVDVQQVANFQRHDKLMPVSSPAPIFHPQAFFDGFRASGVGQIEKNRSSTSALSPEREVSGRRRRR